MGRRIAAVIALIAAALAVTYLAGRGTSSQGDERARALSGGAGSTIFDTTAEAFSRSSPDLTPKQRRAFAVGNSIFNRNWVTAPASTTGQDGLGPTFNAQSCSSCHFKDGRARPPSRKRMPKLGLLLRLSAPGPDGKPEPVAHYGSQLQDRSINGVPAEGAIRISTTPVRGRYDDGTPYTLLKPHYEIVDGAFGALPDDVQISPRVAPAIFGVGLLEAVPEKLILDHADPDDRDGDGISGRPNRVVEERSGSLMLGRFGWKANVPTVEQQNAAAFNGDIGITNPIFDDQDCPDGQRQCKRAPDGGKRELDAMKLERVTSYARTLAVPARRKVDDPAARAGEGTFTSLGCDACHRPELKTAGSEFAALTDQAIHPYTDLLLHDMGPGLADGRPDGLATGTEWRTAPLWGIGLVQSVNRHTRFMHDGRARNLEEAILWHGGEAAASMKRFRKLPRDERQNLIAFLRSL